MLPSFIHSTLAVRNSLRRTVDLLEIIQPLFAIALIQLNNEDIWQTARIGNGPTNLATLRQTDRQTDVEKPKTRRKLFVIDTYGAYSI